MPKYHKCEVCGKQTIHKKDTPYGDYYAHKKHRKGI